MLFGTTGFGNRRKLLTAGILSFLLIVASVSVNTYASPGVEDDSTVDFVLVLDNSGTMASSDPEGLTIEAAKMFIDMLPNKNARVAIVEFGSDYGTQAYAGGQFSNLINVPFPLSDISTIEQKEECKQVIGENTTQQGGLSPVGFAFQAACDVLEKGGATPEDAGILLLSDFRITGQPEPDMYNDGWDYHSIEDAESICANNKWPVYTLEMNFDNQNGNPGAAGYDYHNKLAEKFRSDIPEKAGYGKYFPMTSAADAQETFAEIFKLFFDPNTSDDTQFQYQTTNEQGDAEFSFTVGEMVAELNVTLTCDDTSLINSFEIGHGDDMASYDLSSYDRPIQEADRISTKEARYITVKLMVPTPDEDWKVKVHGAAATELGMYALSIHDMNFQLQAVADIPEEVAGTVMVGPQSTVQFIASYIYDGHQYSSQKVYSSYPAKLVIVETGEEFPMTPGDSAYTVSVLFDQYGTYTVYAVVENEALRTGRIETGTYTVSVQNLPAKAADTVIGDKALSPGESTELNCAEYFISPDGDPLTYSVRSDPESSNLELVQNADRLTINAGQTAGKYKVTILADDGHLEHGQAPAEQSFELEITNRPLERLTEEYLPIRIAINQDSVPGFLKRYVDDASDGKEEVRLEWKDYFQDPDGYDPLITVNEENQDHAIVMAKDEEGITLTADKAGKATYLITATDANDSSVETTLKVEIFANNALDVVIKKIRIPAIVILAALIGILVFLLLLLTGRKLYGIWDIATMGDYKSDMKLAGTRSGKKSSCKLGSLLNDLSMGDEVDDAIKAVQLKAGSRFAKTVTFSSFTSDLEVEKNAVPIENIGSGTKITLRAGNSIRISGAGTFVELTRH